MIDYRRILPVALVGAALLTGAFLLGRWKPRPSEPRTVYLTLPAETILAQAPPPRTRFLDRIVYRTVPPETVKVSVPGAAVVETLVTNFCAAAARPDSAPPLLLLTAGRVERDRLQLYGFTSRASAYAASWRVRAPYEFRTAGDSVTVSQRRITWKFPSLPTIGACALTGVGGYLLGHR